MNTPWQPIRKVDDDVQRHITYVYALTREFLDGWDQLMQNYADDLRRDTPTDAIEEAVETGEPSTIIDRLDWQEAGDNLRESSTSVIRSAFGRAGAVEMTRLAFKLRFDLDNPLALKWVDDHAAELVREIEPPTRDAIRAVIHDAFEQHIPPRRVAQRIRGLVGLTERDARAVMRYWRTLTQESDLTARRVDELADTYSRRLLRRRAELIARTEIVGAAAGGQQQAFLQAQSAGLIAPETRREWVAATESPRTCPLCLELDGKQAGINEPFPGGYMIPPRHPGCRCTTILVTEIPKM